MLLPCQYRLLSALRNFPASCARFSATGRSLRCGGHITYPRGFAANSFLRGGQSGVSWKFSRSAHAAVPGLFGFGISDTAASSGFCAIARSSS